MWLIDQLYIKLGITQGHLLYALCRTVVRWYDEIQIFCNFKITAICMLFPMFHEDNTFDRHFGGLYGYLHYNINDRKILYYISLCSKIRCSLTYLLTYQPKNLTSYVNAPPVCLTWGVLLNEACFCLQLYLWYLD